MTDLITIPFSSLVASDEINARPKTNEDIDTLAASIKAKGLIQPLAVRIADTGASGKGLRYEIIDGRRRYQALDKLVKAKALPKSTPVPVLVRNEDDAEALETSLMANVVRLPMHPVDQHEVFARLAEPPAEIAARFGITERTVKQHLALGRLAPEVRAAWRKGKIDADTAQAFAAHPDPATQASVLERLGNRVQPWTVRSELSDTRERLDQSDELALIGEEAYLAAGGRIDDDLFDEARYVADVPLAKRLAREKLQAECNRLKADGWSWALIEESCGFNNWDCPHVLGPDHDGETDETWVFTYDQKARSGCLVSIDHKGKLAIATGLIRPEGIEQTDLEEFVDDDRGGHVVAPAPAEADTGPAPADPFDISQALLEDITSAQTDVAASVLARDPHLALRVAVVALATPTYHSPAKLTITNEVSTLPEMRRSSFDTAMADRGTASIDHLLRELAGLVAQSLQLTVRSGTKPLEAADGLVSALVGAEYLSGMRGAFSAADYFRRARKETAIAALEEMHDGGHHFGLMGRADLEAMKKADLAEWAAEQAKACGWLPPQLRHPSYVLEVPHKPEKRTASRGKMAAAEQSSEPETPAPTAKRKGRAAA